MSKLFWLEKMEHEATTLVFYLAELVPGEPDELIGLPLIVKPESERFRVHISAVGTFKAVPEMFNDMSDSAEELSSFLFQEPSSTYMSEMQEQMELSRSIYADELAHYVVYAQNMVVHVLT